VNLAPEVLAKIAKELPLGERAAFK